MVLFQSRTDKSWTGPGRLADWVPAAKMFDSEMTQSGTELCTQDPVLVVGTGVAS